MNQRGALALLSMLLVGALAACEHADPLEVVPPGPTFSSLQTSIFNVSCAVSGCHVGSYAAGGLDLSEGEAWANLVNVPSRVPGLRRVEVGEPDSSYLVIKVKGSPRMVGPLMPLGRQPLTESEIEAISEWIRSGAAND